MTLPSEQSDKDLTARDPNLNSRESLLAALRLKNDPLFWALWREVEALRIMVTSR